MTDSSVTPITAASNGGTTTDSSLQEAPVKPERGIARLRSPAPPEPRSDGFGAACRPK